VTSHGLIITGTILWLLKTLLQQRYHLVTSHDLATPVLVMNIFVC